MILSFRSASISLPLMMIDDDDILVVSLLVSYGMLSVPSCWEARLQPSFEYRINKLDVFLCCLARSCLIVLSMIQEAGGVVNIRLVSDFETGKPKGFAFVEYEDAATALSAIRNLNGFECNGRPVCIVLIL